MRRNYWHCLAGAAYRGRQVAMDQSGMSLRRTPVGRSVRFALRGTAAGAVLALLAVPGLAHAQPAPLTAPAPLLDQAHTVNWLFVYKFNASSFPTTGRQTS